eukprot:gene7371-6924_t
MPSLSPKSKGSVKTGHTTTTSCAEVSVAQTSDPAPSRTKDAASASPARSPPPVPKTPPLRFLPPIEPVEALDASSMPSPSTPTGVEPLEAPVIQDGEPGPVVTEHAVALSAGSRTPDEDCAVEPKGGGEDGKSQAADPKSVLPAEADPQ